MKYKLFFFIRSTNIRKIRHEMYIIHISLYFTIPNSSQLLYVSQYVVCRQSNYIIVYQHILKVFYYLLITSQNVSQSEHHIIQVSNLYNMDGCVKVFCFFHFSSSSSSSGHRSTPLIACIKQTIKVTWNKTNRHNMVSYAYESSSSPPPPCHLPQTIFITIIYRLSST